MSKWRASTWDEEISLEYPPDRQEDAVKTVLQQAELLCADWAAESPTEF